MTLDYKSNLMRQAEEAAYSFKGHMKSADWVTWWLRICVGVPIIISVILLTWQGMNPELSRFLNCIAFIFSVLILTSPLLSNQDRAIATIKGHMDLGNDYLTLYKEIRDILSDSTPTKADMEKISQKMNELDKKTSSLRIGMVARKWSECVIEKEMDLDWIKK